MDMITGLALGTWDIITQKWMQRRLPPTSDIGDVVEGLTYVVTGPTSGIGQEIACELARRGAKVILACRSLAKGNNLKQMLEREGKSSGRCQPSIEVLLLDMASLDSVRTFANAWLKSQRPIHGLVNNAGIFSIGERRLETVDGFEAHLGTNYLGAFLLTVLLLPALQRGGQPGRPARIVFVTSILHHCCSGVNPSDAHLKQRGAYSALRAYAQSKFAQVAFAAELRRRLGQGSNVITFAVHPGECATDVVRTLPRLMQSLYHFLLPPLLLTPAKGALSALYCATSLQSNLLDDFMKPEACYYGCGCQRQAPQRGVLDPKKGAWLWDWSAETVGLPASADATQ